MIEQLISSPVSCRFLLKKTVAYSKYTISNIHLQTLNRQGEQISQKLKSPIYEHSFPGGVHCYSRSSTAYLPSDEHARFLVF